MKRALTLIFLNLICTSILVAQSTLKVDSASSPTTAQSFFNASIKQQSLRFTGPFYADYASNVEGSAYFQDLMDFSTGSIVYRGFRFDSIPLMYDINQNKIVSLIDRSLKYSFQNDWVSEFYLNGHHFKHIRVADSTTSAIKSGFYDLIYNGKSRIYVKRTKQMNYALDNSAIRYFFSSKTTYYIEREGIFKEFRGKGAFLSHFKDKKSELNKHLKNNMIRFKLNPEEAMISMASYYENSLK